MKINVLVSAAFSLAVIQFPLLADKKAVDCNKGQRLNEALQDLQAGDSLTFTGTCLENVAIATPGITLAGQGTAIVQSPSNAADALVIRGAARVTLENFTVQNGAFGIHATGGASIALQGIVVQGNALSGVLVEGNSSAYISNSVTQNNGLNGIDAENSSSLTFNGTFLTQGNGVFGINLGASSSASLGSGAITAQQNVLGIQVSINSSFFVGSLSAPPGGTAPTINTLNNVTVGLTIVSGAHLFSFGGNIVTSGNGLDGIDLASRAGMDLDAGSQASSFNNGRDGLHVEELSMANLFNNPQFSGVPGFTAIRVYNNAGNGVSLLNDSQLHMFDQAQVQSHNNTGSGIQADNGSSMTLINSTVQNNPQKDVVLTFGSRGEFAANTIGTLSCDGTSLIRGVTGKTCPTP